MYKIEGEADHLECGQSFISTLYVGFAIRSQSGLEEGTCAEQGFTEFLETRYVQADWVGQIETAIYQQPGNSHDSGGGSEAVPDPVIDSSAPCEHGLCLNGGTCSPGPVGRGHPVGAFTCLCRVGWAGEVCSDEDDDADGISNAVEGTGDADQDGTPNYLDLDSDGDMVLDSQEGTGDSDLDGVPNFLDLPDWWRSPAFATSINVGAESEHMEAAMRVDNRT
eukprot:COSAG02_NODE_10429_length_1942_cov_1.404775_1_plen_221_part_10